MRAFAVQVSGREFWQPAFHAWRCNKCHLVFKSATASPAALGEYYQVVDFRKWEIPGLFPTEERVLAAVRALRPGSHILDFGCSTGRLLSRLVGSYRCYGFEINPVAASVATEKGISIVAEDDLFGQKEQFDAIVLVDVYEHLADPTVLLKRLATLLRRGGRLVICTGNADAPAVGGDPATFWYFQNVEHLIMLTRCHADYLAGLLGARLAHWEVACHYRAAPVRWLREWSQNFAYQIFHTSRAPWLRPILRWTPILSRAEQWSSRPMRVLTADHAIAVFEKQ